MSTFVKALQRHAKFVQKTFDVLEAEDADPQAGWMLQHLDEEVQDKLKAMLMQYFMNEDMGQSYAFTGKKDLFMFADQDATGILADLCFALGLETSLIDEEEDEEDEEEGEDDISLGSEEEEAAFDDSDEEEEWVGSDSGEEDEGEEDTREEGAGGGGDA